MICKTAGIECWRRTIPKQDNSPYPWSSIFNHIGLQTRQWICKIHSNVSFPLTHETYRQPRRIIFDKSFIASTRSPCDPPGLQSRRSANHSMSCKTAGIECWRLTIPKQHSSPDLESSIFNPIGLQTIQWICNPDSHVSFPLSHESYRQPRRIII